MFCRQLSQFLRVNQCCDVRTLSCSYQSVTGTVQYSKNRHRPMRTPEHVGRRIRQVSTSTTNSTAFVKNLFLGTFNKDDVFPFPEITQEEFDDLNQMVEPIEKFFSDGIDSKAIDVNAKIDDVTMQGLKELGLFGQQIPEEYGGLELSNTGYSRIAEVTSLDASIATTLAFHQTTGLKGILIASNKEQKAKYLPKLATGEHLAAFCLTEPTSGSDVASIKATATLSSDGKHYLLNGSKVWVTNGGIADVFTVFAQTEVPNDTGVKENKITAFIVEKSFGRVITGTSQDKLGIRGSNTCKVTFEDTPVPVENVLGEVGGGFKLAMNLLNSDRFNMGSSGAGVLKKLIGMVVEHARNRKQFDTKLSDFGLIQEKIARMTMTAYVIESMTYLTAGMLDRPGPQDCSLEAAIVKIYSSEGCWQCISEALQVLGGLGYMKDYPYERYLRDSRIMTIVDGTNEILRLQLAVTGFKFAGNLMSDDIIARAGSSYRKLLFPSRKPTNIGIENWVHEDLKDNARQLDEMHTRYHTCVAGSIAKYRKNIVNEQLLLNRCANMVINLYAMTACLSRASHSKSLGLPNCDHEVLLTKAICNEAYGKLQDMWDEIVWGSVANNDELLQELGKDVCDYRRYKAEHPLTKFWS